MSIKSLAGLLAISFAGSAIAADLPVRSAAPAPMMVAPLPYNWSGFYLGLHAGGAWTPGCTRYQAIGAYNTFDSECRGGDDVEFIGGAQIGFNFQSGSFVYGLEADISGLSSSNSSSSGRTNEFGYAENGVAGGFYRISGIGSPNVLGTVRARLGFAADRALFYVTGGLAWASGTDDATISYWNNIEPIGSPDVVWRRGGVNSVGWALGAGVEYAFTNNWTVRAEYLYVDFGKEDNAWSCTSSGQTVCGRWAGFTGRADMNLNSVRVGLNYKFGGGGSAAPVVARY